MAELILKEAHHFTSINVSSFKNKISGQHNPEYICKHLKRINYSTKAKNSLFNDENENLKGKYDK